MPPFGVHQRRRKVWLGFGAITLLMLLVVAVFMFRKPPSPIEVALGDGRILQIESVSYGTTHRAGRDPMFKSLFPWLPNAVRAFLGNGQWKNTIDLEEPGLVVWVTAIDANTRTNVDCQGIRLEFVDKNGDLFGQATSSWFGSMKFWRCGHIFRTYPRNEKELTLRITTWRQGETSIAKIANPNVVKPTELLGAQLPQRQNSAGFDIVLKNLIVHTNGQGEKAYYETPTEYVEPELDVLQNDQPVAGWEKPEWLAEDELGNRGQFLGSRKPALKFITAVYPQATNFQKAKLLLTLPEINLATLSTNLFWNLKTTTETTGLNVLGVFHPGTHSFHEGVYETSTTALLGPRGGAPTGWTSQSTALSPKRVKTIHNHYSPYPIIYISDRAAPDLRIFDRTDHPTPDGLPRPAIRLRDQMGRYWVAEPEQQAGGGIRPFLLKFPPDVSVTTVLPELVLLEPLRATFVAETKGYRNP